MATKHTNDFIDKLHKGDKFYLAVFTRGYNDAWIGEVEFQSKVLSTSKTLWSEPKMTPTYITEYYYTLRLKTDSEEFFIKLRDFGWGDDTTLESNNIEFSGADLLMSDFWIADCYMTTDCEAFKGFVKKNQILETSISAIERDKKILEEKLEKLYSFRSEAGTDIAE